MPKRTGAFADIAKEWGHDRFFPLDLRAETAFFGPRQVCKLFVAKASDEH